MVFDFKIMIHESQPSPLAGAHIPNLATSVLQCKIIERLLCYGNASSYILIGNRVNQESNNWDVFTSTLPIGLFE